jgi:SHS2 domain-containing protein
MSYRWIEHTGEVELEIEAASDAGVFEAALAALAELVAEDGDGEHVPRDVDVDGSDRAVLLARWLEELVYLIETEDLVPETVDRLTLTGDALASTVGCRRAAPRHLVKGVTYHRLSFTRSAQGRRATVVLDV